MQPGTDNWRPALLIVDDDESNVESLERVFQTEGYELLTALDGRKALEIVQKRQVEVVLTDLKMAGVDGMDLLRSVKKLSPHTEVILITAFGSVEKAVEAMRAGAYDFIAKPFKKIQVTRAVRRAMEKQLLLAENRNLRRILQRGAEPQTIVGNSVVLRRALDLVRQVAPTDATVLIYGESGTGKELFARQIHAWSKRANRPFVAFNCAALPPQLAEAELFGHEKGAYTGADRAREGLFREAHKGTLFLDEVGELSTSLQGKLLRVLQDGEIRPVGSGGIQYVDVRVIAATKDDLESAIERGRFRQDLFFRLNVVKILVPPLRQRKEDIPLLVSHFVAKYAKKHSKTVSGIDENVLQLLHNYDFPGNVRELENIIERAVILAGKRVITQEDLPETVHRPGSPETITIPLGISLDEIEERVLRETLRFTGGNKKQAADLLGISLRTVYRILERRP